MRILINATNLKAGGGLQVADSICCALKNFPQHHFVVVLSSMLKTTSERIQGTANIEVFHYDIQNSLQTILKGRDTFLDNIVATKNIDIALTVFGPSRWTPQCPHLSGFAMPHLVIAESPFFKRMSAIKKIQQVLRRKLLTYFFKRSTSLFYSENPYISQRLQKLLGKNTKVYTVTNYYNQVFDNPQQWKIQELPAFHGVSLLTITANYPHKNLSIAIDVAKILKQERPNFNFRIVFTITEEEYPEIPADLREHFLLIGRVDIAECPSLYQQADVMFQPTLLECFTATYPEAMKMEVPIVTTDLEFARGLCGEAAMYYDPLSAQDAAEAIYKVATNKALKTKLTDAGKQQLQTYDTYEQRAEKLIRILEKIVQQEPKG